MRKLDGAVFMRVVGRIARRRAGDDIRWKVGTLGTSLQTNLVTSAEFWKAFHETGAIYFIRNARADEIKVGHSRDPKKRLADLQVGCSSGLVLIGVIAATREIEPIVHRQFYEGRVRGEWFYDRGVTSQWLTDITQGEPLYRHVWNWWKLEKFFVVGMMRHRPTLSMCGTQPFRRYNLSRHNPARRNRRTAAAASVLASLTESV